MFPRSLHLFHKYIGCTKGDYTQYVVCIKCHKLYKVKDSVEKVQGLYYSRKCSNVINPNHTQTQHRKPCGQKLMMTVASTSGKETLYPFKIYCYKSIKESLQMLISRNGFVDMCESWRKREQVDGVLSDIYDGKVWQTFQDKDGSKFFYVPHNYGVSLNVDWFQPFKHVNSCSIGAIYLVLLNLPRSERFKRKNVIWLV